MRHGGITSTSSVQSLAKFCTERLKRCLQHNATTMLPAQSLDSNSTHRNSINSENQLQYPRQHQTHYAKTALKQPNHRDHTHLCSQQYRQYSCTNQTQRLLKHPDIDERRRLQRTRHRKDAEISRGRSKENPTESKMLRIFGNSRTQKQRFLETARPKNRKHNARRSESSGVHAGQIRVSIFPSRGLDFPVSGSRFSRLGVSIFPSRGLDFPVSGSRFSRLGVPIFPSRSPDFPVSGSRFSRLGVSIFPSRSPDFPVSESRFSRLGVSIFPSRGLDFPVSGSRFSVSHVSALRFRGAPDTG